MRLLRQKSSNHPVHVRCRTRCASTSWAEIDQWYSITDDYGVVFILNASSVAEAHTLLEALPLGQAKLMTFQLIPLGPISPLALLLSKPEKAIR